MLWYLAQRYENGQFAYACLDAGRVTWTRKQKHATKMTRHAALRLLRQHTGGRLGIIEA